MGTQPWQPSSFLAFFTASHHGFKALFAKRILERSEALRDTTLPRLFFTTSDFLRPPPVFSFLPEKTLALAPRPWC